MNKDGVEIELNVGYQYRARQNELHRIVSEFKDHDGYEEVLKSAGENRQTDRQTNRLTERQTCRLADHRQRNRLIDLLKGF